MKSQHAAYPSPRSNLNFLPPFSERQLQISAPAVPQRAEAEVDALEPLGLSGQQVLGKTPQPTPDGKLVSHVTRTNATPSPSNTKDV